MGTESGLPRRSATAAITFGGAVAAALLWIAGASAAVNYDDFQSTDGLRLNGTASSTSGLLRLTEDFNDSVGTAFTKRRVVKAGKNFKTDFVINQHGGTDPPADGMAFVIQSVGKGQMGDLGGGLGYGGIGDSLIVEFDIYDGGGEPGSNHVAISKNGDAGTHLQAEDPGFALWGNTAYAQVTYSAKRHKLKVWVNNTPERDEPLLEQKVNLARILDGDGFAGFTGSTGGLTVVQDVLEWHLKSG